MREALAFAAVFFGFSIAATVAFLFWTHLAFAGPTRPLITVALVAGAALILGAVLTVFFAYAMRPKPPKD
jgi:hypothetical protein